MHKKMVCTEFNPQTWEERGVSWLRAVKSAGYTVLVVDRGLSTQAVDKIVDLQFQVVKDKEPHIVLAEYLKPEQRGLFCLPTYDFVKVDEFFQSNKMVCTRASTALASMVMPIANIKKRAEAAKLIESKELLDPGLACGDQDDWFIFSGFYEFLLASSYLERRTAANMIAMNLFAAFFPGRVGMVA